VLPPGALIIDVKLALFDSTAPPLDHALPRFLLLSPSEAVSPSQNPPQMRERGPWLALRLRVRTLVALHPHQPPLVMPLAHSALRLQIAALLVRGGEYGFVFEVRRLDYEGVVGCGLEAEIGVPCLIVKRVLARPGTRYRSKEGDRIRHVFEKGKCTIF
jgi:hypothetical protein